MVFQESKISDHLEEAKPLLLKHWNELESDEFPLDPDYDLYLTMEKEGRTKTFVAKNGNGVLVGYAVFILRYHPHYKTILVAACDIVFIDPYSRGTGMFFIQWCDEQLKSLGVKLVQHHVKLSHDFSDSMIRNGYMAKELKLQKRF